VQRSTCAAGEIDEDKVVSRLVQENFAKHVIGLLMDQIVTVK
jgi:hypothetical protein